MSSEIEAIIKKLEIAQDLLYKNKSSEAATAICEAQSMAQFIKDSQ